LKYGLTLIDIVLIVCDVILCNCYCYYCWHDILLWWHCCWWYMIVIGGIVRVLTGIVSIDYWWYCWWMFLLCCYIIDIGICGWYRWTVFDDITLLCYYLIVDDDYSDLVDDCDDMTWPDIIDDCDGNYSDQFLVIIERW